MEEKKKRSFWESFKIWFGLGALMFGTYGEYLLVVEAFADFSGTAPCPESGRRG